MEPLAATARAAYLQRLAEDQFDVLVIGGGITGAGVALDAAARGYRVAVAEKADFASGTSSKSTKLTHCGIRYLPQFDFPMIHGDLAQRNQNTVFPLQNGRMYCDVLLKTKNPFVQLRRIMASPMKRSDALFVQFVNCKQTKVFLPGTS
jgi:FAD dependent oxidoreductase